MYCLLTYGLYFFQQILFLTYWKKSIGLGSLRPSSIVGYPSVHFINYAVTV